MAGHSTIVGRGALPTWTSDRYGVANQALYFKKGAHIEVPYQALLTPAEITISVWVKVDTIWAITTYFQKVLGRLQVPITRWKQTFLYLQD